jgi:two-component system nitrate/nitrite response regulator NarL
VTILRDEDRIALTDQAGPGVLLVEDHQLLAQSLAFALRAEDFRVAIAELHDAASITELAERLMPQIVLLDLDLGAAIGDGRELIAALRERGAMVLVVSGSNDRVRLADCLELGAVGVLSKSVPFERLVQAVTDVAAGRPVMSEVERFSLLGQARSNRLAERERAAPFQELTARERQVLAALMEGKSCERLPTAGSSARPPCAPRSVRYLPSWRSVRSLRPSRWRTERDGPDPRSTEVPRPNALLRLGSGTFAGLPAAG